MRRLLPILAATAALACASSSGNYNSSGSNSLSDDSSLSGNYSLVSVSGVGLPAAIEFGISGITTLTHTAGSLTLTSDSTFMSTLTFYVDDGDPETSSLSGTFTIDEFNVIRFTPGAGSEDGPFEGALDGDRITIPINDQGTLVFRR